MWFLRYLALEILVAVTMAAVGGAGLVRGGSWLLAEWRRDAWDVGHALPPHGDIDLPPEPSIDGEPAGTFLGMSDEILLARAGRQPVVAAKLNRGGSSISFRLDFADGSRAAFKPAQTNLQTIPRKEVAAYRINRLLGLNAVPPAMPRSLSREELLANLHPESQPMLPRILAETLFNQSGRTPGMVQYWIPRIVDSGLDSPEGLQRTLGWLTQGLDIPPADRHMAAQVSNLIVFDFITANPDRYSGGNMKMSPDGQTLYFMDNTMAFFLAPEGTEANRKVFLRTQRFSRALYQALDRLTTTRIQQALSESGTAADEILTPAEVRAVVARRTFVQRHIDQLIAQHGERQVLVFP